MNYLMFTGTRFAILINIFIEVLPNRKLFGILTVVKKKKKTDAIFTIKIHLRSEVCNNVK